MAIKSNNWWVAIICSLTLSLNNGYLRVAGLLYIATMERFDVTKSQASLPFFWCNVLKCLGGPLVGLLAEKYGSREVSIAGFVVSALGIGMCFFAEHITVLIILWGCVFGFGISMSTSMTGDILNDHFDKSHIATASGICFGGASIGSFILLYFCDFILSQYDLSGTFLILSALSLNGLPLGMILIYIKATEGDDNAKRFVETLKDSDCNIYSTESSLFSPTHNNQTSYFANEISSGRNNADCDKNIEDIESGNHFLTHNDESSCLRAGRSSRNEDNMVKLEDIPSDKGLSKKALNQMSYSLRPNDKTLLSTNKPAKQDDNLTLPEKHTNASNSSSTKVLRYIISCFRICWNPTFLVICTTQSSLMFVVHTMSTIIMDAAKDKKVGAGLEIYSLSCFQIADTVGRFGLGWVTDCNLLSNVNFNAVSYVGVGICSGALALSSNFIELIVAVSLFGILSGATMIVFTGTLCEFIEKDQLKMAISARFFMSVPMFLTASPLIRLFRENMGSYDGIFYVLATLSFVCSILSLLIPSISKCRRKN